MSYDIFIYPPEVKKMMDQGRSLDDITLPVIPSSLIASFCQRIEQYYDYEVEHENNGCRTYKHKNDAWGVTVDVRSESIYFRIPYWSQFDSAIAEAYLTANELCDHGELLVFDPQVEDSWGEPCEVDSNTCSQNLNNESEPSSAKSRYKKAVRWSIGISVFFWLSSIISFTDVELFRTSMSEITKLLLTFGDEFYLLVSAFFWMIMAVMFYEMPKVSALLSTLYILLSVIGLPLYFPFFTWIAVIAVFSFLSSAWFSYRFTSS